MKNWLFAVLMIQVGLSGLRGVDINKLVAETQQTSNDPDSVTLVWWIPTLFWDVTLQQDANVTAEARQGIVDAVSRYTIFAVVSAKVGPLGGLNSNSREQILSTFQFRVGEKRMTVLEPSEVTGDARNLIAMMKPVMSNMLGQFGEGMEFIMFSNRDENGEPTIDPKKAGAFEVTLDGETYRWRLPLGSVLPIKLDPESREEFPGNYNFNPFTGKKLVEK